MNESERINKLLNILGLTPTELAKKIGLSRAQSIYDIQNGKVGISKRMANLITSTFPDVSSVWLLVGENQINCNETVKVEIEKMNKALIIKEMSILNNKKSELLHKLSEISEEIGVLKYKLKLISEN